MSTRGATERLTEYCAGIRFSALPSDVIAHAKYLLLDFLGLAPKGIFLESTQQIHALVKKIGGKSTGTIIGTSIRPLPQYAALANAASSHSLSLDDIYTPASIHPGSGIFSTALAVAAMAGVNGKRFFEGVVAGYEGTLRVANAAGSKEQ